MFKFIRTTVIGGLLFILPLVLIVVLLEKAIHLLRGGGTSGEVRLVPASEVIVTELSWLTLATGLRRGGRGMLALMQPWVPKA